ncbi:MAG: DUF5678 domain-containing protein [Methanosarcinales archaeon]
MFESKWIKENYQELQKKYPDMWIAVSNKEILAADKDYSKVKKEARKKNEDFMMEYILSGDVFVF